MTRKRWPMAALAALLAAFVAAVWLWQSPGRKLTTPEIDRYLALVAKVPFPPDAQPQFLQRLRTWAEADDGQPVYMLNLMRYYPAVRAMPGAPAFTGTPEESNRIYEDRATPLALKAGAIPLFAGPVRNENVMGFAPPVDQWSRVLVMRYPSRRAFFDLVTDPEYAPIAPYKLAALDVNLVPMAAELTIPDLRIVAAALALAVFLAAGWWRAARRSDSITPSAATRS
ncbi:MAG: hypothetical protein IT304_12935 [Dehalococcoidia bacterium]|nr:hypothetical protein [Dehalococcoidia bacterium]